jgi:tetratricopeptide (TPR) repeat protein
MVILASTISIAAGTAASVVTVNRLRASIDLKHAEDLSNAGRFKEAITDYINSVSRDPINLETWYFLGSACYDSGALTDAEKFWSNVTVNAPDYILIHDKLARLYEKTGRLPEAEAQWRRQLKIDPYYAPAWSELARMLYSRGALAEALGVLDSAVQRLPQDLSLKNNRGILLVRLNRLDEARQAFEEVLAREPSHADARHNLDAIKSKTRGK